VKISVDQHRCEAYGFCEERAPELVHLNDDGILQVDAEPRTDEEIDRARRAVRSCPVAALRLEG
jgi:ferredoxin